MVGILWSGISLCGVGRVQSESSIELLHLKFGWLSMEHIINALSARVPNGSPWLGFEEVAPLSRNMYVLVPLQCLPFLDQMCIYVFSQVWASILLGVDKVLAG